MFPRSPPRWEEHECHTLKRSKGTGLRKKLQNEKFLSHMQISILQLISLERTEHHRQQQESVVRLVIINQQAVSCVLHGAWFPFLPKPSSGKKMKPFFTSFPRRWFVLCMPPPRRAASRSTSAPSPSCGSPALQSRSVYGARQPVIRINGRRGRMGMGNYVDVDKMQIVVWFFFSELPRGCQQTTRQIQGKNFMRIAAHKSQAKELHLKGNIRDVLSRIFLDLWTRLFQQISIE